MTTLIVGCGYLGKAVATALLRRDPGGRVFGTTRSPEKAAGLEPLGVIPVVADLTDPRSLHALPEADRIVYAVGYDRSSGRSRQAIVVDGLARLLRALSSARRRGRLVVSSSTSVYGQIDGSWVDEDSPTEPIEEAGRIALQAESVVRRSSSPATILRFSGLYGPGRVVGRSTVEKGEVIGGDPDRWLNLVHVEDAAEIVVATLRSAPSNDQIYVVSDDVPMRRRAYYELVARGLRAAPPRFEGDDPGRTLPFGEPDKRVRNARMKAELGLMLKHPGVGTSLASLLT